MKNLALAAIAALTLATAGQAQLALNELYVSHSGTDSQEFVEIIGTPGASLQDVFVCVVEGDGGGAGTLDLVVDLSGNVIPADGYFVLGTGTVANVDATFANPDNNIENGTETVYLLQAQDAAGLVAAVGTNIGDTMTMTTTISTFGSIVDLVGLMDSGATDVVFDGATVIGPDGNFLPAGIFRNGDFPNDWNDQFFLDFDVAANLSQPRTPGAANTFIAPVGPAFPGNGGDVSLTVDLNGSVDVKLDGIHTVTATDDFGFEINSPNGTLDNRPFAFVATIYTTGASPILGPLVPSTGGVIGLDAWVDVPGTTIALLDGTAVQNAFSPRISPFGFEYGPFDSDPALAGTSALLQVIVDAPGFGAFQFATSDARELNFTM